MTSDDRADQLTRLHAQLTAAVEELADSAAWQRMLQVAARLPAYSPSNVLLIATQRPDATRVAGYRTWQALGRQVRKGERGIAILAPCLYRAKADPRPKAAATSAPSDPGEEARRSLRGFRVAHVFDVSQTEGDPLPEAGPELLRGAAPGRLWERLAGLVTEDGFTVSRGDCAGANGYTRFDDRVVRVRDDVDPAQAVKTLAHELGHIRADHGTRFADSYQRSVQCRGTAEIEAESIAYLVTTASGMNTGAYSVPYVAGWADGQAERLRATAATVITVASRITKELQVHDPNATSVSLGPTVHAEREAATAAWEWVATHEVGLARSD